MIFVSHAYNLSVLDCLWGIRCGEGPLLFSSSVNMNENHGS